MRYMTLTEGLADVPEKFRSLAAARWALATLSSRTMYLEGDDAGILMPFGDLHNHSPPPGPQLPDLGRYKSLPAVYQPLSSKLPCCTQRGRFPFSEL